MNICRMLLMLAVTIYPLYISCNSSSNITQNQPGIQGAQVQINLDANSSTVSVVKVGGLSGDTLVIDSGTTILQLDAGGDYIPLSITSKLMLALSGGDTASSLVPAGMIKAASFGITASVDGKKTELVFSPVKKTAADGMPYTGVHWVAQISDTGIHSGAILTLYKITGLQGAVLTGTRVVNAPVKSLFKISQSSPNTDVSPDGTGSYNVNYYYKPLLNSTPAVMPSTGVYWTEFTSIPDTTYTVGNQTFGGPLFAGLVSIGEPSTTELLADLCFSDGVNCVTYTGPNDKVQYWVERTQSATGKTTALKVASTAANIPYLSLNMYSAATGQIILFVHGLMPDGAIVHAPDGSVITKPYDDPGLKIGGAKELYFKVNNYSEGRKTTELFSGSGYSLFNLRYNRGIYSFDVTGTQDGRALIEDNILSKALWFPIKSQTNGNVGYYEYRDSLTFNVTTHGKNDTVSTQKITLQGTIDNPAKKTNPVTDILIVHSSGTQSQQVHATINGDSTFTAELSLYPGLNIVAIVPTGKNSSGADVTFSKYNLLAKNEKTQSLILTYEASWTGKFDITKKTTSYGRSPDTSVSVTIVNVSANLKMNFRNSKLWYIKQSHENAVECSELDNCYLFSGSRNGPVSVSVNTESQSENCEGELPLMTKHKGSGSASLDKYSLGVYATLVPWDSTNVSTERKYMLEVYGEPEITIHTDPAWPRADVQSYDCYKKAWVADTNSRIGPRINIDENLLQFTSTAEVEAYSETPDIAKSWSFTAKDVSADGLTVTEYTATLSIQP